MKITSSSSPFYIQRVTPTINVIDAEQPENCQPSKLLSKARYLSVLLQSAIHSVPVNARPDLLQYPCAEDPSLSAKGSFPSGSSSKDLIPQKGGITSTASLRRTKPRNNTHPDQVDPHSHNSRGSSKYRPGPPSEYPPLIIRASNHGLQGLSSISGEKHHRLEALNEDAGSLCEADLEDRNQNYHIRIAWVFDGHGPSVIGSVACPGKLVSQTAINIHQSILSQKLGKLIRAPVLPPESTNFLTSSRQAVFSDILNETQKRVHRTLPSPTTMWAGTTATVVLSIEDKKRNGLVSVVCSNFGDSKAVALSFKVIENITTGETKFVPEIVHTLTSDENIKTQSEVDWVEQQCMRHGYRRAQLHPTEEMRKPSLRLVMVPSSSDSFDISKFEPFTGLDAVENAMVYAKKFIRPEEQYSVYTVQLPYLWKVEANGYQYSKGLQVNHYNRCL